MISRTRVVNPVVISIVALTLVNLNCVSSLATKPNGFFNNLFGREKSTPSSGMSVKGIIQTQTLPTWEELSSQSRSTATGARILNDETLRATGEGSPHTDAQIRLFGTNSEPRVTLFRDTAAWCPYCQKVWLLLEEKKIPYKIVKINMRRCLVLYSGGTTTPQ